MTVDLISEGLRIGELARLTKLSTHVIRIWERRYGFPKPMRLLSGHRRYTKADLPRLRAIQCALEAGFRPHKAVPASMNELKEMIGHNEMEMSQSIPGIQSENQKRKPHDWLLIYGWVQSMHCFEETELSKGFEEEWAKRGPMSFIQECVIPFLSEIGRGWKGGEVSIAEEHFASEQLGDFLSLKWREINPLESPKSFVLATFPEETHILGLQMTAILVALQGIRVVFLGLNVPVTEILKAAEKCKANAICVSLSNTLNRQKGIQYLKQVRKSIDSHIPIVVGGKGAPLSEAAQMGCLVFKEFLEFRHWLKVQSL